MPRNIVATLQDDQLQIIGLEFRVTTGRHGTQELAMFAPTGLIIPRLYSLGGGDAYVPNVTIHTTMGDYTLDNGYPANW